MKLDRGKLPHRCNKYLILTTCFTENKLEDRIACIAQAIQYQSEISTDSDLATKGRKSRTLYF